MLVNEGHWLPKSATTYRWSTWRITGMICDICCQLQCDPENLSERLKREDSWDVKIHTGITQVNKSDRVNERLTESRLLMSFNSHICAMGVRNARKRRPKTIYLGYRAFNQVRISSASRLNHAALALIFSMDWRTARSPPGCSCLEKKSATYT